MLPCSRRSHNLHPYTHTCIRTHAHARTHARHTSHSPGSPPTRQARLRGCIQRGEGPAVRSGAHDQPLRRGEGGRGGGLPGVSSAQISGSTAARARPLGFHGSPSSPFLVAQPLLSASIPSPPTHMCTSVRMHMPIPRSRIHTCSYVHVHARARTHTHLQLDEVSSDVAPPGLEHEGSAHHACMLRVCG